MVEMDSESSTAASDEEKNDKDEVVDVDIDPLAMPLMVVVCLGREQTQISQPQTMEKSAAKMSYNADRSLNKIATSRGTGFLGNALFEFGVLTLSGF
jgi:hypothetical protein